jgi:hypothetical protein
VPDELVTLADAVNQLAIEVESLAFYLLEAGLLDKNMYADAQRRLHSQREQLAKLLPE